MACIGHVQFTAERTALRFKLDYAYDINHVHPALLFFFSTLSCGGVGSYL